jgi:plasmid stability protein
MMARLTIRKLDDSVKSRLRVQAAVHGRSMEDEARDILCSALGREPGRQRNRCCHTRAFRATWRRGVTGGAA